MALVPLLHWELLSGVAEKDGAAETGFALCRIGIIGFMSHTERTKIKNFSLV